eukprot:scaffold3524_cov279-Chaetoceros_neogracile.AAC.1
MRSSATRTVLAIALAKNGRAFAPISLSAIGKLSSGSLATVSPFAPGSTRRYVSSGVNDIENSSREESGYVIIDVRNPDEIAYTGKLAECVETLPLPIIAQTGAFNMSEEDFEENFGFAKPALDEKIVFSCKAGIRSMHAAQLAGMSGYTKFVNYSGGLDDWFR